MRPAPAAIRADLASPKSVLGSCSELQVVMSSRTPTPQPVPSALPAAEDHTAAVDPQALAKALQESAAVRSARENEAAAAAGPASSATRVQPALDSGQAAAQAQEAAVEHLETVAAPTTNRAAEGGVVTIRQPPLDPGAPMGGTPPGVESFGRYCPACGRRTNEPYCPTDGTQTLLRRAIGAEAMLVAEGDVIAGRYRIAGVLGRGGFGAVYSAEHTGTQQRVALKMLLPSQDGADEAEVRRFYREAQVTAKLRHPNTVRVFDVGQTDNGALYIAMELLHGPTLESRLRELAKAGKVMQEAEAVGLAISVLRSLHEAHAQGLVHRDLKPANIILADSGDDETIIKVLDFGIARAKDSSLTGSGTALGTPAYMSPEQCVGTALDGRSDLYSLGIILYRCVTGQPPFTDPNPLTLMFQHAQAPLPDLQRAARTPLSPGFCAVVTKALAKSRDDRYASAREMRAALESLSLAPADGAGLARALLTPPDSELDTVAQLAPGGHELEPTRAARPLIANQPTAEVVASGSERRARRIPVMWVLAAAALALAALAGLALWLPNKPAQAPAAASAPALPPTQPVQAAAPAQPPARPAPAPQPAAAAAAPPAGQAGSDTAAPAPAGNPPAPAGNPPAPTAGAAHTDPAASAPAATNPPQAAVPAAEPAQMPAKPAEKAAVERRPSRPARTKPASGAKRPAREETYLPD